MKALILAVATALPQYSLDQMDVCHKLCNAFEVTGKAEERLTRLYAHTAIDKRYSVIEDFQHEPAKWNFWGKKFPDNLPTTHDRNKLYKQEAPRLAEQAARNVLDRWGGSYDKITHIVSVSCTGMMAPGIECILAQRLGLPASVKRYGLNFMGCFGAFRALEMAQDIVKADGTRCVLIVCTELCSLHMQLSLKPEVLIGNALFGDGAAAVLVGGQEHAQAIVARQKAQEQLGYIERQRSRRQLFWEIKRFRSHVIADTANEMKWKIGDLGFVMHLTRHVPALLQDNIKPFVRESLESIDQCDVAWAVHPGGRKIVEAVQHVFSLDNAALQASWDVLKKYGNMSSATFLFVLDELYRQHAYYKKYTLGLGFGPGLACESVLLEHSFVDSVGSDYEAA